MKAGKPLKRKTPLHGNLPLSSRSRLSSNGRLKRTAFVAKAPKVTREERAARKTVKSRSLGICELHGGHPATDMHHRLNRSQGGLWSPENLLHICRASHAHITTNPAAAREQGWAVPSTRKPADVPAWLAGHGYVFLLPTGDIELVEDEVA